MSKRRPFGPYDPKTPYACVACAAAYAVEAGITFWICSAFAWVMVALCAMCLVLANVSIVAIRREKSKRADASGPVYAAYERTEIGHRETGADAGEADGDRAQH